MALELVVPWSRARMYFDGMQLGFFRKIQEGKVGKIDVNRLSECQMKTAKYTKPLLVTDGQGLWQ